MTRMDGLDIEIGTDKALQAACVSIRHNVYVDGMGISVADEFDGRDDDCVHVLVRLDGVPVGAARLMQMDHCVKLQRVAVLETARGRGIGGELVKASIDHARDHMAARQMRLGAQVKAMTLYARHGFVPVGDIFLDVGMPHQEMVRDMP